MKTLEIIPIGHPIGATVSVPGSKSATNRALLLAALADGCTTIEGALRSDDSARMVEGLGRLGVGVSIASNRQPANFSATVQGSGGRFTVQHATLEVGNAGTAARFLTALATLGNGTFVVDGDARMRQRPIGGLVDALGALGAAAHCTTGSPPVHIGANGLRGGRAVVSGAVSSQFLSALLMVAPYAAAPVVIEVPDALSSRPYVELTLAMMADFGVHVARDGDLTFAVRPSTYQAIASYAIEPDASSASYAYAAAALVGGTVVVRGITENCRQGDVNFVRLLERMGCRVEAADEGLSVSGDGHLRGLDVNLQHMPDVAPTLATIAPFADTPTRIRSIASARRKECDRVAALCAELARAGVRVVEHEDGLTIFPCERVRPTCVRTYKDHRMAMAFALMGLRVPGIQIEDAGCVSKSFPGYFEMLEELRG